MSQPVKLSDALVLDARLAGEMQERSIAGQVEFWAKLGQSVDLLLKGQQVLALRQMGKKESLAERLASVDSPAGRARVEAYLQTRPYPHYEEGGQPGLLLRTDEDGARTLGRFVNRVFVPMESRRANKVKQLKVKSPRRAVESLGKGLSSRSKTVPKSGAKQGMA